jgi:predicted nucleic acid-binding protein
MKNMTPDIAMNIGDFLINMPTVKVCRVPGKLFKMLMTYLKSISQINWVNDCIAYVIMKKHGYHEIYSLIKILTP